MDSGQTAGSTGPHPASLSHAALIGLVLALAVSLIFWATAVAQGLPAETPAWVKNFQPASGIVHLVQGLFWMGTVGTAGAVLLTIVYNLVRRARHARHAR